MPLEFLGMLGFKPSESNVAMLTIGGSIDHGYLCRLSKAHEGSSFDGVLVGCISGSADGLHLGQAAADNHLRVPHRQVLDT